MSTRRQVARFVVAGAFNSALTYGIYLLALQAMPYRLAYSVAFAAGILLAYWLNARHVFRVRFDSVELLLYVLAYFGQYLLGLGLLSGMVGLFLLPPSYAALLVMCVTIPLSFLMGRAILGARA